MYIDPRHLEQIAAIVEHGTLHEAARQLGTSQPALSRMITNLENRIGMRLFERSSRPLTPTEIGEKFARHGRAINAIRQQAFEEMQVGLRGMSGELNIGAPPFLCERLVGEAISSFLMQRPDIQVRLVPEYFPQLERIVLLNQVDIVICPLRLLTSSKNELAIDPLFRDDHVIVARKDHHLSKKMKITPRDLEESIWISHSEHSMLRSDMATALTSFGVSNLKIAFQSESAGAVFEMLRNTDFLTVLPRYAISRIAASNGLCALPVQFQSSFMMVGMVTPRNRLERPLLSAFAAHMHDYVAKELSDGPIP
ncbi:MAG: LysR family transcriptional regulator [Rhodobacteraceae bacterium]|nr:LysR family transcriptional regulator [Paracoccaceae bacterium]